MKTKVYLLSGIKRQSCEEYSRTLFDLLRAWKVEVEFKDWDGLLKSLPTEPCLIYASENLDYPWHQLLLHSEPFGHLCFYNDQILLRDGTPDGEFLKVRLEKFLSAQTVPA
jgi:hypothetical protein